jgi:hypothetical protein
MDHNITLKHQELISQLAWNVLLLIYFAEESSINFLQFWFSWIMEYFCILQGRAAPSYCLELQYAIIIDA